MQNQNRPVLICGAMDVEIQQLRSYMRPCREESLGGYTLWLGEIDELPVALLRTEIGIINSACATALAIHQLQPQSVLNIGCAGGHSRLVHRGDIVLGKSCVNITSFETPDALENEGIHVEDWTPSTFSPDEEDRPIHDRLSCDKYLLEEAQKCSYDKGRVLCGVLGSGDVWNREADHVLWLNQTLHTMCEDMESVSVYSVAHRFSLPVLGIRIISNHVLYQEEYDRSTCLDCQHFVLEFLHRLRG
ncbi:MAG: hypothetical protein ACOX7F_01670 [Eubacteriales bacterium]|jgi:adenosylhomocysteine nucleosidase